jgi:hypothetical protein
VIEGLIATVMGAELKVLCTKRGEHHRTRSTEYREQAARFADDIDNPDPGGRNVSSPKKGLLDKAYEHGDAAANMEFLAEHLVDEESYRLGQSDLRALGIIRRMNY